MFKGHSPFSKTTKLFPKALKAFIVGMIFSAGILGTGKAAFATDSTLTITLSENAVTANVAPTATPSGTFVQSSGITVGVSTNHISGYILSISASDTTTPGRLKNGSSYLQSIASETTLNNFKNADLSNSDFATSLGLSDCAQITESSNCKGIWGYKPNYLYNATMDTTDANDLFLPTPGTAGQAIAKTSGPNATANEYTITLGAKVSPLATIGSYTNTFVLMAVGNNIPYTIEFSENTVQNMPVNILDGSTSGTTATIPSGTTNTPTRPGYKFAGWCDQATTKSGNSDTCAAGHSHRPGDTISLNQTGANNIKLYAMWQEITQSSCSSSPMLSTVASGITYMQDINSTNSATVLSALTTGNTYQIKDNRDNETYCVGKLADGKLWLLDNLALDLTNSTVLSGMNENNTHASNTTLNYLKNGGGTTSDKYAITGVINWTDSPTYASSFSYSDPLVNLTNKNVVPTDATSTAGQYKVGGYYNYCAASAGSYCYGNGASYPGASSGNATEDICPKGWRMPTGNTSGEYQALYNNASYNTYANYRSALRLPLSGYFYYGSADYQGSYGGWWSSTRGNNYNMYLLNANTSYIYPADGDYRNYGFSVRCVLGS